jgi:hypothetical protein
VTQPSFVPAAEAGSLRRNVPGASPEIGRPKKAGLLGAPTATGGSGRGTPGPDAGYALTVTHQLLESVDLPTSVDRHDVEVGIALLSSKRAGLVGRAPTRTDSEVALDLFGFRSATSDQVIADRKRRFSGLAHSYSAQRAFVDGVSDAALRQLPGRVKELALFSTRNTPT